MHWFVELRDFLSSSQCVWRELFGPCPIETCFLADMFFRGEGGLQHPHVDNLLGVFCVPTQSFNTVHTLFIAYIFRILPNLWLLSKETFGANRSPKCHDHL